MSYTVKPSFNPENGELSYANADVQRGLHSGEPNTRHHSPEPERDPAFAPFDNPKEYHPAFFNPNDQAAVRDFWNSPEPLNDEELSMLQDSYIDNPSTDEAQRIARLTAYKMTGETDQLLDDDFEFLGINPPNPDDWSNDRIDQEILGTNVEADEATANAVLAANIGNDSASVVVQHLTHQVYAGEMSAEQAYAAAYSSGVPTNQLYAAFNRLLQRVGR
jgi:hypothetical protein